jgi:hypothetical protein
MPGLVNVDLGSALSGIGTLAKDIRAAITGKEPIDATAAAELALKAQDLETQVITAQSKIDEVEAASPNLFIAGWRPCIGWICALGVGSAFVLRPVTIWLGVILGRPWTFPPIDTSSLMSLVVAMLGLAAYRTVEKAQGTNEVH